MSYRVKLTVKGLDIELDVKDSDDADILFAVLKKVADDAKKYVEENQQIQTTTLN